MKKSVINVKRRKNESFESLMRRFRKQVQMSGNSIQAKKVQYRKADKSENVERASTLTRLKRKAVLEYYQKIGKVAPKQ